MTPIVIQGRGGKSGGSGATESKDTLRSTQIAEVLDIISEGECEGLVNGLKSIYLDGVAIQNEDGTYNFSDAQVAWMTGTQGQEALPDIDGVATEYAVNVDVTYSAAVVRTITNPDIDKVRVTISVPQLSKTDTSSGSLGGSTFSWAIDVQSNGGGYVQVYAQTLTGKCMSEYTRSIEVSLTGDAPWDIRVRRTTADSTSSAEVNEFAWSSYTAVQSIKLRYPNMAYTWLRLDAEQFSSVPARSFHWRGLRIRVPTNYDPVTRTYSGTWDGTFKVAWSNNPAWVYYDMATHDRYGLGEFLDASQVNKWVLYTIGQYCDGLVPDGKGGTEPRFTINVQITDRQEAFKLMQQLAEVFRGMAYWTGSTLECFQDAPEDPGLLYSPANVVDGNFAYQDTSERSLHSVFIAYWTDMDQMGKSVPEAYAPSDLLDRYGMRELEIKPLGCTSQGMAARLCRWARHTEQMEGDSVTFTVGSDGVVAAPGKVFKVADPSVAGERLGGRIITATLGQLQLDAPVNLAAGETYTVSVLQPDASDHMGYVVEERTVTNDADAAATVLNVTPAFSAVPTAGTIWVLQSANIEPTLWRCLAVEEVQGKNQYQITGVAHNPSKFDAIELGLALDEPVITRLSTESMPPQSLTLLETVYTDKTINKTSLTMSIVASSTGKRHKFTYRVNGGAWIDLPETSEQTVTLTSIDAGLYDVSVRSCNALGVWSAAITKSLTLVGGKAGIKGVTLQSSALTFKVYNSGTSLPSSISMLASVGSLDEDALTWEVIDGTATLSGSGVNRTLLYADMGSESVTIKASVVEGDATYADTVTLVKVRDGATGEDGDAGEAGPKYAVVALYQWAATQPGNPSGQSTWTWATATQSAYTGGNSWQTSMPANPGNAGLKLWSASMQISAAGTDISTTVYWPGGSSVTAVGSNGTGTQSAEVAIYAWALNLASLPSLTGTATYTWSTKALSSLPSGWSATPGTTATSGQTLYKASLQLQDATTVTTTTVNYTSFAISAAGYAGLAGTQGIQGSSYRLAYAKVSGSTIGSGTVTTAGNTSFPPDNSWGRSETWAGTVPTFAADESVMQTDGVYDPTTGNTVWGSPYLSSWKVGSLSAISANLGSVTAGSISINGKFVVSSDGYLVAKGGQFLDESGNVILSTKAGATASLPSGWVTPDAGWLNTNVASGANLVYNSGFSNGLSGWSISEQYGISVAGAGVNLNGDNSWNVAGAYTFWCRQAGTASDQAYYFRYQSANIAVAAGQRYVLSAYTGAHRCSIAVFLQIYNAAGSIIADGQAWGANTAEAAGGSALADYKRVSGYVTMPTGAAYARVVLHKSDTYAGQADSYMFVTNVQLEAAGSSATTPGPYSDSGTLDTSTVRATNPITAATASTYIASAAIGLAQINTATIGTLAALTAYTGTLTVDSGGYIRGGKSSYSDTTAGFYLGYDSGYYRLHIGDSLQYLRWTGTALDIKLNKVTATASSVSSSSYALSSTTTRSLGTSTVTASGGTAPYSYSWAVNNVDISAATASASNYGGISSSSNTCTFLARGATNCGITVIAICTITDANGLTATVTASAYASFGTGPA